jgi:hypothetical protein
LYKPIYIGKGKKRRYLVGYGRTPIFINKINKIKKSGLEPIVVKLYENLNEEQSFEFETKLINEIGRVDLGNGPLLNMTNGGEKSSGKIVLEKTKKLIAKKQRKIFLDIQKEFENRKYILLTKESEYKNEFTKLNYICLKGHKGSISWGNFQQGHGCKICENENKRKKFSEIKKEFERIGYVLLTEKKDYKNSKQKLKYICPEGHEGSIRWNGFQRGQGCKICDNEKRKGIPRSYETKKRISETRKRKFKNGELNCSEETKKKISENHTDVRGENNHFHKLIKEQVIQIKLLLKEGKLNDIEIGKLFGVCSQTISLIKRGKIWNDVLI